MHDNFVTRTVLGCSVLAVLVTLVVAHIPGTSRDGGGNVITFDGVPDDSSLDTVIANQQLLNSTLNGMMPGDTLLIAAETKYFVMGGIYVYNRVNITLQIDGTLAFSDNIRHWPKDTSGNVLECFYFINCTQLVFTSADRDNKGVVDGQGARWWGLPGIGYLVRQENRPRLMHLNGCNDVFMENLLLLNSPYWTFWSENGDGLEIQWTRIDARRDDRNTHDLYDLTAFNTDGFDVTGKNVYIHDCYVWNQDDCIAVKDGSENMLFERIEASGLGLTIGSIGGSVVRNITFRQCIMNNTYKGIYLKFRDTSTPGSISDVLYEDIVINNPEQWAIWIGPAQQSDSRNLCAAHPCSLCWPTLPRAQCNVPVNGTYSNVTLRNITINNGKQSPGVIYGNSTNPILGLVFDSVVVNNPGTNPWGDDYYYCENVKNGVAKGNTWPVPPCLEDQTDTRRLPVAH